MEVPSNVVASLNQEDITLPKKEVHASDEHDGLVIEHRLHRGRHKDIIFRVENAEELWRLYGGSIKGLYGRSLDRADGIVSWTPFRDKLLVPETYNPRNPRLNAKARVNVDWLDQCGPVIMVPRDGYGRKMNRRRPVIVRCGDYRGFFTLREALKIYRGGNVEVFDCTVIARKNYSVEYVPCLLQVGVSATETFSHEVLARTFLSLATTDEVDLKPYDLTFQIFSKRKDTKDDSRYELELVTIQ